MMTNMQSDLAFNFNIKMDKITLTAKAHTIQGYQMAIVGNN